MGKSFVFKDRSGGSAGYMMLGLSGLTVRFSLLEEAKLTVFDAQGQVKEFSLQAQTGEQVFPFAGEEAAGAYISAGTRLLGTAGQGADAMFEQKRMFQRQAGRKRKAVQETDRREPEKQKAAVQKEAGNDAKPSLPVHTWPQRRWPPPACMPEAHYELGVWKA